MGKQEKPEKFPNSVTFGESACLPMRKRGEEKKKALEEKLCEVWAILNKRNIFVSYSSKKEFTL